MFAKTAEFQFKHYHIFFEDIAKPCFGCSRDDQGIFYIWLYKVRLSIYGRTFNRLWKDH